MDVVGLDRETLFQSAPLTEARGDKCQRHSENHPFAFQSAPLTEARGDLPAQIDATAYWCFNPLPSPKQGETWDYDTDQ